MKSPKDGFDRLTEHHQKLAAELIDFLLMLELAEKNLDSLLLWFQEHQAPPDEPGSQPRPAANSFVKESRTVTADIGTEQQFTDT